MKGTRHILLAALLLLSAVGVMGILHNTALAEGGIIVARDLPEPAAFAPGETFEVTITFTAMKDEFNAVVLHDEAPAGWQVTLNNDACLPTPLTGKVVGNNGIEYTWLGPYDAGESFTAVYEITVPEATTQGTHNLLGGWLMYFIVTDEHQVEITGNSEVLIKSGAPEETPAAAEEPESGTTPGEAEPESGPAAVVDIAEVADPAEEEIAGTRVRSPAPEPALAPSGSQAVPAPAPAESALLYPPAPKPKPFNWPVLWGAAGGAVIIIVVIALLRLRRRLYY